MAKRKNISQKVRFEVFKRDKFQCQYCGKSAPDVILQVDHIKPHSKGGEDSILNFITACFDCNSGKGDRLLSDDSAIVKQRTQLELLQERKEQIEMMMQWHDGLSSQKEDLLQKLTDYWNSQSETHSLSEFGLNELKKISRKYPFAEILEAMDIACNYFKYKGSEVTEESWITAFRKIPGIIKIKQSEKEKPYLKDLFYIRGILRNRTGQNTGSEAITLMEEAYHAEIPISVIKSLASKTNNYWHFESDLRELIEKY